MLTREQVESDLLAIERARRQTESEYAAEMRRLNDWHVELRVKCPHAWDYTLVGEHGLVSSTRRCTVCGGLFC